MSNASSVSNSRSVLFDFLMNSSILPRKFIWRHWYNLISQNPSRGAKWTFMNYGYFDLNRKREAEFWKKWEGLDLTGMHPSQYYMARLYYHLCKRHAELAFSGKDMVEVGCGRGGGAAFVARNFPVKSFRGIDLSPKAIKFCQETHGKAKHLRFLVGDSQDLPLEDASADIVINVESSHCYPDFPKFVGEVYRVLRPGGYFLYTDFRKKEAVSELQRAFASTGFKIRVKDDIAKNVFTSLEHESQEKERFLERTFPKLLQGMFKSFAGTKGTFMYEGLKSQAISYPLFVLEK